MIRAIAIDDEPEALDIISFHASKLNNLELVKKIYHSETGYPIFKKQSY
jgi:hypothetical protein